MTESEGFDIKSCRICLTNKKQLCPLFKYKVSGNYAEMLTAIADVKVAVNDGLPDKICTKCCTILEKAYLLKTVAERSDRKLRKLLSKGKLKVSTKKIAFDSFTDVKSEIPFSIKPEPKWEMEIDVDNTRPTDTVGIDEQGLVIANTIIKKVDLNADDEVKVNDNADTVDLTWTKMTSTVKNSADSDLEFFEDTFHDDDNDADYVPPVEKVKKLKRTKLTESKLKPQHQGTTKVIRRIKVLRNIKDEFETESDQPRRRADGKKPTTITCYPIMQNGTRGAPILLKRPKDATILKVHSGAYKRSADGKVVKREKPVKILRTSAPKQKEKMVCPVCGILTYTLGNHIATHEEKKKYTCSQCPKTFTQKSNLFIHAKQHTGVKDHICEICGAGFYSQKSLVRHNLIHKGERPYPCNLCNKRFIARCDLNRHLRIHSGYKPFKCNTCTMSFNAKHQLQNHERMHTGERPYTCQVCNVAFSYKVNLNNHVFKVHGINLKFKSIHNVTEEVLRREMGMVSEASDAIAHIMPQLGAAGDVPTPAAHETVPHHAQDY